MMILIKFLMIIIVLVNIAMLTLFERKILGYMQNRKGPNKVLYLGLLQPFSDFFKLFFKTGFFLKKINKLMYYMAPIISFLLMMMYWMLISYNKYLLNQEINYMMIYIMVISSFSVYVIMFSGWSSNSKYALLGSLRGIVQVISYEVSFSFLVMILFVYVFSLSFKDIINLQKYMYNMFTFYVLFMFWFIILMVELNRTPFDFSESESELVSGFNVEYGSLGFMILYMCEYGNILFMSWLSSMLFFNKNILLMMLITSLMMIFRGTFVRYRYDIIMNILWKNILPFVMMFFLLYMMYSIF
uniref:NADH-ubiquinone oxidoreductase chain 1 n=1 Tax=Ptilonyssus chloris TaxID=2652178 RepID=A0A5Q0RZ22_9ACAR|nr:NADH dehydrogenase subunit 1 [Ptilonyssus chloris]QGA47502.1 NADH dehydrogenase subunit 1 [Ptilonyssus chloris]